MFSLALALIVCGVVLTGLASVAFYGASRVCKGDNPVIIFQ
jgi:hypothetical protein